MKAFAFSGLMIAGLARAACGGTVTERADHERNGSQRMDAGGPTLAGVGVSNRRDVAWTDGGAATACRFPADQRASGRSVGTRVQEPSRRADRVKRR